jgi:hypothetical protein
MFSTSVMSFTPKTFATLPMAKHTKSVGVDVTNAHLDIRQRINALLKWGFLL